MKRCILIAIGLLILNYHTIFAQLDDNVIIQGYENITWGADIGDVRQAYKSLYLNDEVLIKNEKIERFIQDEPGDMILQRRFQFRNGKLFKVTVIYDLSNLGVDGSKYLFELFVTKYGIPDEQIEINEGTSSEVAVSGTRFVNNINSELKISFILAKKKNIKFDYTISYFIQIEYENPMASDEIESNRIDELKNSIKL